MCILFSALCLTGWSCKRFLIPFSFQPFPVLIWMLLSQRDRKLETVGLKSILANCTGRLRWKGFCFIHTIMDLKTFYSIFMHACYILLICTLVVNLRWPCTGLSCPKRAFKYLYSNKYKTITGYFSYSFTSCNLQDQLDIIKEDPYTYK